MHGRPALGALAQAVVDGGVASMCVHTSTVGPAPEIVAPRAPSDAASASSAAERGYSDAR